MMVSRWCIWCETGVTQKDGWWWIHPSCAEKLMDIGKDITSVREIFEGTHPRNKDEVDRLETVEEFLRDMEAFDRRWKWVTNKLKEKEKQGGDE